MKIREFQEMMRQIYFEKDKKRGISKTFMWLSQEIGELSRAILKRDLNAIREEMADVLAWLASLANLLEIDLENAAISKYPHVCPRCHNNPCTCEE
ncbi:MAG: MazG nucleotide pyrophosphohydrolase domain-containing protein [Candidatus Asgardarchaeia archaeon]